MDYLDVAQRLANEVLTGLIGGMIVALTGIGYTYVKRRSIERRYPISGRYLSFFEDVDEGKKKVVRSESVVRQKGKAVSVVTATPSGRSWTLEGTILPGGHISGVYSADATYDEGVGSFYLKIDHNRLDGMWNGYDHVNRTTGGGRYWFRRKLNPVIADSTARDVNAILHIATEAFGIGYLPSGNLQSDDRHFCIAAKVDGEVVGFCIGYKLEQGNLTQFMRMNAKTIPADVRYADENNCLGTIKTIAVRRSFRGYGIGAELVRAAELRLVERGVTCVLVPAWMRSGDVFLDGILTDHDYSRWTENPVFWKSQCEAREFECVAYNGKCVCGVAFYRKGILPTTTT